MSFVKGEKLYEGKAKVAYHVCGKPELVWLEYKDSLTAFNAEKKGSFSGKGALNCQISTLIFRYLESKKIKSHWVASPDSENMIAQRVEIIPLEVVVRNVLAGSTAKKLGIEEGRELERPLVEFYYKDDSLGDPFISDDQALMMNAATVEEISELKNQALQINSSLIEMFKKVGVTLVDFKIEFGRSAEGEVLLADEITPDTCRLWDMETGEKLDKDRFRRDLGDVSQGYSKIYNLLSKNWGEFA